MPKTKPSQADPSVLVAVADYFKVLSESSRLQILSCLKSGPMNVMEIAEATGLGQANLSKHLKVLTQAGLVSRQPKGTSAYYEITDPMIFELCELVCDRISQRLLQQAKSLKALQEKTPIF
ncbi:ArsR/SmtB family transcription factor [Anabaena sp. FACHB-709]|uniref:Transcriptional regulator n=2 Tax=Nostocaceae TaxID=1162 RepID=A0A1Z4KK81_ANAVA|nr:MULTISPECIES: metalloregulator ArsR/SmtB family transcription factor [Nostocaceae]BAY69368.1 transcriptional regulator [Trichormus variabilis NIES-23]HBW32825.1 transcriptional regulator [Nostoc sp. UBA8866]MBD2171160.1 helix-turn-helix transcriptional regulator [Anabaena cylindrica FACHB-318]MBD2262940.1 helix-turn-helix transcriptional regulator [Anabaena sp. FACHB-709]MBD2272263.1 helix-turn-helix transcriptional regulator [Nostoc sp. PCC 7120 = FACHB-418]